MTMPALRSSLLAAAMLACTLPASANDKPFRIGVIDDMSGTFSDNGGPGTALSVRMAVEDFGGSVLGRPIEVVVADHQSKPDIGSAQARQFIDERGVSVILPGGSSSVGLAVQAVAREREITTLVSGGYAPNFTGNQCSPYGTQWAPSTAELANAVAKGVVDEGGNKWFFLTADYVFGHNLAADAGKAVKAAGGQVLGEARHPLGTADLSSPLLTAQSSGANVVGLANAGPDLVNSLKQMREFGVKAKPATMLVYENNVVALGLPAAQGLKLSAPFYWDINDATRAWAKRYMARFDNKVPTMGHALAYIATTHYLKAVKALGSDDAKGIARKMRELPITGDMIQKARIQDNGRVVMDMHLFEVKSPAESKSPADLYKVLATLPSEGLFTPAEQSGCQHLYKP
ncbi:MAG: branched-chain amino acid ABC transporter substrate-binding protein [Stutzerimonas stutzeri]|uniref:ABC transporter substrate-binding protein n=1 Tax=Bosea eneae TaxID=151454 RepID=A0ABW0IT29_9HYPH|nr:MAG: branched-chain amino acid ABC transporter substrate-binding protein [Stutzerimonas stutzeri]